jgi:hypothetical protein
MPGVRLLLKLSRKKHPKKNPLRLLRFLKRIALMSL